ncbi:MACPF domain-containing protein [Nephila pilipes]|uniref:MACPF domain-containing protein n=1 Tax=Nephila pilipes TaxID=299642 RepID=A0A8X6Q072_NEPPI|nr:MACPF domain-containing protein [Nephila pilipes]
MGGMMMYVLPMLLGQTYDLGKNRPGVQIFPANVSASATVLEQYFTDSQYRLVESNSQVKEFLDVSGALSLKIKSGMIDVSGEGSYTKDISSYDNSLQILIKVHFETITRTIPFNVKPLGDWTQYNPQFLGTHYMRSLTMGGDLIAAVIVKANNKFDMERIKGALSASVNTSGGTFEGEIKAKLEKLRQEAQDSASMEIRYWATVPLEGVSYTTDGLLQLIKDFPVHVKRVNNGLGNPLRMELLPLKLLQPDFAEYMENRAIGGMLEDMDYHLDDILATRKALGIWMAGLPPIIPAGIQKMMETFSNKMNNLLGVFLKSIDQLDTSANASMKPITEALDAYKGEEGSMPQKYMRQFLLLRQEIYREAPELKPRIGGAEYNYWGRSECEGAGTKTVMSGVMSSSQSGQNGGSSELICAPTNPENPDPLQYFPSYDPKDEDQLFENLLISPIIYNGELEKYKPMTFKQVACARCRSSHRTTLITKPGDSACPKNWTKEYNGLMMAPGRNDPKGDCVCMDLHMQPPSGNITFGTKDASHVFKIQEISIQCGSIPCGPYKSDQPIPCVVCSI